MILVTGGTGFVGQVLIRQLIENGYAVRTLVRPAQETPELPKGVPVEIALANIADPESMRAALVDVDTVFHLVGAEFMGPNGDLLKVDVAGTRTLVEQAEAAGVKRVVFLSHLGADRASAYPVMKAKGIAEEFIRRGSFDYTILRTSLIFGANDHFTSSFARVLLRIPLVIPLPAPGDALLQPIWIEDLATCLLWTLEKEDMLNKTVTIGGPEFLTIREIVELIAKKIGIRRTIWLFPQAYMRMAAVQLEYFIRGWPLSSYWLDYLAINRTTDIDAVSRNFGLLPARISQQLDHLLEE